VPVPIFGAIAQTERARHSLTPENLRRWTQGWTDPADPAEWWISQQDGIALFRPEVVLDRGDGVQAVLGIRGAVQCGGRQQPPDAWPGVPPSATGTETVLYDLLDRDTAAIAALRGQFALAFWDGRRRRLLLSRDHLGQRAMFIRRDQGLTIFCSELAPLLATGQSSCTMDAEAMLWYLAFGMPPPGRTLVAGVDRIPAAHALSFEPGNPLVMIRYWTPLTAEAPHDADDHVVAALRAAVGQSVARTVADHQEVGLLLSGGVDSTYLASTAVGMGSTVRAFTGAFTPDYGLNETEYATAVADWLQLSHQVVTLSARDALQIMDDIVLHAAEPCSAWATVTYVQILAAARQTGVTSVLSGLGADEIFGGYDHFRGYYSRFIRYSRQHPPPSGAGPFDSLLTAEAQSARRVLYPGVARFFDDTALRSALTSGFRDWHYASRLRSFYRDCQQLKPEAHAMEMMVAHECQHRIPDLLHANFEPVARRFGLEMHYPFLDPDVVVLAAGLSAESRYRTSKGQFSLRRQALHPRFKHVMLQMSADRVPEVIRERPRKSLTAPFGGWMTDPAFARPVLDRLHGSSFWDAGVLKKEWLDVIVANLEPRPSPWVFQLWALVTLVGWWDRFADPAR
jgi:asparagine synthase (glutamine-hydrolysing)